ncbi:MAG: endonuclease III [Rickettsiales bacterium]|jgi:endonuclease-3|nr:endonuclease III [Rickettsiales bacterium]
MITPKNLEKILHFFEDQIGDKKSELRYTTPFTFAIAVLLSAQSTDKGVNIATAELFKDADTPQKMLALGERRLSEIIKRTGFFNVKAKHILALCEILIERFGSELPKTRDELEELPGIGRKSANVIMNEIYNAPYIGVDTHVMRLVRRLDLVPGGTVTPVDIEESLEQTIPEKYKPYISNWLVLYGRYVCTAVKPHCLDCKIIRYCKEPYKNLKRTY